MEKRLCDRCKAETKNEWRGKGKDFIVAPAKYLSWTMGYLDICDACFDSFNEWWNKKLWKHC